ncbi:hypothetical protein [Nitrosospira sp. Is2]|jgi:hypothetical protein|uniref:hypothetical protein n=1 Tax=Nitrosospira sp. Is2 TaxID=3080532 RepID=UPI002953C2BD|nr:hypothetical protein [Nitrosospira sp. Is2]WON73657.1 hypothetical protein R5L00_14430 [Nitrosospira sp. Is2]
MGFFNCRHRTSIFFIALAAQWMGANMNIYARTTNLVPSFSAVMGTRFIGRF